MKRIFSVLMFLSLSGVYLTLPSTQLLAAGPKIGRDVFVLVGGLRIDDYSVSVLGEQMSSDAMLIAGISPNATQKAQRILYLWDLRGAALPDKVPSLEIFPKMHLVEDAEMSVILKFSPRSDQLALYTTDNAIWQVFSIPDLQLKQSTQVTPNKGQVTGMAWSKNGQYIGLVLRDGLFAVWEMKTGKIFQQSIQVTGELVALDDGWLVLSSYTNGPQRFAFCTLRTERCEDYATAPGREIVSVSPDGALVATQQDFFSVKPAKVWLWTRQPDGRYVRQTSPASILASIEPGSFSPKGTYFVTEEAIWRVNPPSKVRIVNVSYGTLGWLPDEKHYLTLLGLKLTLFNIDQLTPLDELDLAAEWYGVDPEYFPIEGKHIVGISQDGKWVVVSYGGGCIVVPILYPQ